MGRAEIRRTMKNEKKAKTATYNLTKAQLDAGELDMEKLKEDLWDYVGVRLEEGG